MFGFGGIEMSEIKEFIEESQVIQLQIKGSGLTLESAPSIPVATVDEDEIVLCLSKLVIKVKKSEISSVLKENRRMILETKNKMKIILKK